MEALAFPWIIVFFIIVALFLAIRKRFIICFVLCTIAFFLNWYIESFSFKYTFFLKSNISIDLRKMETIDIVTDMSDVTCIVMGVMNDVCSSYCLQVFAYGLRDAWWEGGFGYGATIHNIA